jgi:single-strand DNA-binding protein
MIKKEWSIMNNVLLTGNLTKDAELLEFNNGEGKAIKFTLAVTRKYKNANGDKDADFIPIIYFTNYAHKLIDYLTKGSVVSVAGKISIRSVEGEDGSKRYFTNVVAENIDFLNNNKSKVM